MHKKNIGVFLKADATRDIQEFNFMLDCLEREKGKAARNLAELSFIWVLRVGDVLALRWSQVELGLKYGQLTIKEGKSRRKKTIYFDAVTKKILLDMRKRRPRDLFLFNSRRSGRRAPIVEKTAYNWLVSVEPFLNERRLEMGRHRINIGTHTLRKSGARLRWQAGAKLEDLQRLLNHESIETTLRYLDFDEVDMMMVSELGSRLLRF